MTGTHRKKKQPSQAQHWMFLASASSFLIATLYEAAKLAAAGVMIYSGLIGYQGLSLGEKQPLVNGHLRIPNIIILSAETFGVRVWINMSLNGLVFTCECQP